MAATRIKPIAFGLLTLILLAGQTALAQRTKIVVILDIETEGGTPSTAELARLTESVYAAATEVSPEYFSVVSRDKLLSLLPAAKPAGEQPAKAPAEIGALLGADMVFAGELRQTSALRFAVTLKLVETGSGRILGLEKAEAQDLEALWSEMRKVTRQMLLPLITGGLHAGPDRMHGPAREADPEEVEDFLVQFRTTPTQVSIELNGKKVCDETPCSYRVEPGDYTVKVKAKHYKTHKKREIFDGNKELVIQLEPKKYNYIGMHDARNSGYGITVGMSPVDSDYKVISVLSGSQFGNLNPIVDGGFNGEIFGYRQLPDDEACWSILGFGPSIRIGRLMLASQVQLLQFRRDSDIRKGGWYPGVTTRIQIPLINSREVGGWSSLVPTPAAGLDVFFDDLEYDQYHFWLGFSWLGGVQF
ncbi:MAG: PEGA domain-containing protein [Myxococcota bacterium]|nr:PEGA domain-containing protein [Myxococcota bacterium]